MSWHNSLIRISNYEVETLQKRLAEIVDRRFAIEMRIAGLVAEDQAETLHAKTNAEAGVYMLGFREGVRIRREKLNGELASLAAEEEGARDALSEAFEALKKFEHVAEAARVVAKKEAAKRETAALDELGLRRAAR